MAFFTARQIRNVVQNRLFKQDYSIQNIIKRNFQCTTRILGSIVPFNLSDIGEGIQEVAIKEWFVKEGDQVAQFDNICEVQSDKASVTITSRYDGTIKKIHYNIDQTAFVGKPLVDIEVENGNEQNIQTERSQSTQINETEESIKSTSDENDYSLTLPSVRRLARQYKIDLKTVKGTGKNSRILKEDVLRYLDKTNQNAKQEINELDSELNEETIKIKGFQKSMFQTMTASLKIPHFSYTEEIKVTKLSELRKNLNLSLEPSSKLSFVPFFIKALSLALTEYPILNSSLDIENENIIIKKNHNIGIAMDTKAGLAVPVIRNVQNMSILKISEELQRLLKNGKSGTFSIEDLQGGTFTFSNIGVIGGLIPSPVILPPQVAIVAIGTVKLVPRFTEDLKVVPEEILNITGTGDHRIIDGSTMANFVNLVKTYIENPYLLMLKS